MILLLILRLTGFTFTKKLNRLCVTTIANTSPKSDKPLALVFPIELHKNFLLLNYS